MMRKIRDFKATDPNGNVVVLEFWQEASGQAVHFEGRAATKGPRKAEIRLDGSPLNRLDKGRYQNFLNGTIYTSDEPDAP